MYIYIIYRTRPACTIRQISFSVDYKYMVCCNDSGCVYIYRIDSTMSSTSLNSITVTESNTNISNTTTSSKQGSR